jgi:hypothetical protein
VSLTQAQSTVSRNKGPKLLLTDTFRVVKKHTIGYSVAQAKITAVTANTPSTGVPFVSIKERFELAQLSYDELVG